MAPPVLTRCEGPIDYNWATGGPGNGIDPDRFSVRWRGWFTFEGGLYRFSVWTDDGMRLWVDDQSLIDEWRDQAPTIYQATRVLSAGRHEVRVEYYERASVAVAQVRWERLGPAPVLAVVQPTPTPPATASPTPGPGATPPATATVTASGTATPTATAISTPTPPPGPATPAAVATATPTPG